MKLMKKNLGWKHGYPQAKVLKKANKNVEIIIKCRNIH